jgi:hypothetical protein
MAGSEWLLVEAFGDHKPSVIGVGSTPKSMVPLRTILGRGRYLSDAEAAITSVTRDGETLHTPTQDGKRRVIAEPLASYRGDVHGVYLWIGGQDEEPPARDPAGAWHFNLSTDTIGGSDGLLDLYGVPAGERRTERFTAEAFGRLVAGADEAAAFAKIVRSQAGEEHQAVWTVRRDDDQLRSAHFSCRAIAEQAQRPDGTSEQQVVLRGITHDVGPAAAPPGAPPVVLAQQVLAGLAEPGTHRAIVNVRTLKPIRWLDEPMPGIAWEYGTAEGLHWIHPDDLGEARKLVDGLARSSQSGRIRFRTTEHDWKQLAVTGNLVILDSNTNAALLTLKQS